MIEKEVEVDETDIPFVAIGQTAKITVDAFPERSYTGRVTEVGNSPIQAAGAAAGARTATNFKVVVTLEGDWTNGDPAITRFLTRNGRNSIPFYLFVQPGEQPEVLPQILTPSTLITRAEASAT